MIYTIRDSEAGNAIERYNTLLEAMAALECFEEEDKKNGTFVKGFYEIYNTVREEVEL